MLKKVLTGKNPLRGGNLNNQPFATKKQRNHKTMKKVRFGIIGADFKLRANMVFENYPKDQSELTAICDHNPAMLEKFRQEHPEYSSGKLFLGHNMRYVESILKMKEVIDSGIRRSVKI